MKSGDDLVETEEPQTARLIRSDTDVVFGFHHLRLLAFYFHLPIYLFLITCFVKVILERQTVHINCLSGVFLFSFLDS